MTDIIERLEKATGPDRGIDYKLASFFHRGADVPEYTASIDAAMTLHAEGKSVMLSYDPMSMDMGGKNWRAMSGSARGSGRTPALALCIAALKAREQLG